LNNATTSKQECYLMEEDLLLLLKRIVRESPGSALVLCSSWRIHEKYRRKAVTYLTDIGIPGFISCTVDTGGDRTDEIIHWLRVNTDYREEGWDEAFRFFPTLVNRFPDSLPESEYLLGERLIGITHFIVLDDQDYTKERSGFLPFLLPHIVKVDKKPGLTDLDAEEALNKLRRLW
jgi:hypothetical protein